MTYVGEERRKVLTPVIPIAPLHCIHENEWGRMTTAVENLDRRINGSLHEMEKHMESGRGWRMALIGIIFAIILQIITFAYLWGGLSKQVEINTRILNMQDIEIAEIKANTYGNVVTHGQSN